MSCLILSWLLLICSCLFSLSPTVLTRRHFDWVLWNTETLYVTTPMYSLQVKPFWRITEITCQSGIRWVHTWIVEWTQGSFSTFSHKHTHWQQTNWSSKLCIVHWSCFAKRDTPPLNRADAGKICRVIVGPLERLGNDAMLRRRTPLDNFLSCRQGLRNPTAHRYLETFSSVYLAELGSRRGREASGLYWR